MADGTLPIRNEIDCRVTFWKVVAGVLLAAVLCLVDPLELLSLSSAPICYRAHGSSGIELAGASGRRDAFANQGSSQLFGLNTEPVTEGSLREKWLRIKAGITKDLEVVAQCRAGSSCPAPARSICLSVLRATKPNGAFRIVGAVHTVAPPALRLLTGTGPWWPV